MVHFKVCLFQFRDKAIEITSKRPATEELFDVKKKRKTGEDTTLTISLSGSALSSGGPQSITINGLGGRPSSLMDSSPFGASYSSFRSRMRDRWGKDRDRSRDNSSS